ncbi:hypothetical protein X781_11180 [Mannheimia sp. USDA-ARS-USMARC-1261]|uniref:hypothetical protein n=1 Tax=unclassified Mannheimia TaxID=2645054 RepID=UPI0003E35E5A|nr:hypothetical protein [Mannheimia sp. USDA-ARS-USMARC-1261]AHG73266.1 hypothetical protein X781_11180 [Mannheimia sp. USDA-ARS-USMARC-1261]
MKAKIAKNNFVLMDLAIDYYLHRGTPPYTFMSLWNDKEPYPLNELKICLKKRIMIAVNKQKQEFTLGNDLLIQRLNKKLERLNKIKG